MSIMQIKYDTGRKGKEMKHYCESCMYACPWDYSYNYLMCSRIFKEKEPFEPACEYYVTSKDRDRNLTLSVGEVQKVKEECF